MVCQELHPSTCDLFFNLDLLSFVSFSSFILVKMSVWYPGSPWTPKLKESPGLSLLCAWGYKPVSPYLLIMIIVYCLVLQCTLYHGSNHSLLFLLCLGNCEPSWAIKANLGHMKQLSQKKMEKEGWRDGSVVFLQRTQILSPALAQLKNTSNPPSSVGPNALFWPRQVPGTRMVHIHACRQADTHIL